MKKNKIARLIVTGKQYYKNRFHKHKELEKVIEKFVAEVYRKQYFQFILTPGGFLRFKFPKQLHENHKISDLENKFINDLKDEAECEIIKFFKGLKSGTFKKLKMTADYMTIGIDGANPRGQHIELVGVYDFRKEKLIHWTGKFYPIESQKRDLIKINDLNTHFVRLNKQNIIILGCHDLNVYNPRGQASVNPDSCKAITSKKFRNLAKRFKPDIILQHPHTTDTPNIWNLAWRNIEKEFPQVQHFASGIKYYNYGDEPRGVLDKVAEKTKKGDVIDFVY